MGVLWGVEKNAPIHHPKTAPWAATQNFIVEVYGPTDGRSLASHHGRVSDTEAHAWNIPCMPGLGWEGSIARAGRLQLQAVGSPPE